MKNIPALLIFVAALPVCAGTPGVAPLSDAKAFQESIRLASRLKVYEGLPHQMFESAAMKAELKRSDTTHIANFPFYTPGVLATDDNDVRSILQAPSSIVAFSGEKLCGGFHPDYCVAWEVNGKIFYSLICFGCHEVIFHSDGKGYRYDLQKQAHENLKTTLSTFRTKRPEKK